MTDFIPTAKHALRILTGGNFINEIDAGFQALAEDVDATMASFAEGTLALRPDSTAPSPGIAGRFYRATDTGQVFIDTGMSWIEVPTEAHAALLGLSMGGTVRSGKSIIATPEMRSSAAYGLLGTPDQVSDIVMPTDGLLLVGFRARWFPPTSPSPQNASAAIFLNDVQVRVSSFNGGAAVAQQATSPAVSDSLSQVVSSGPLGLVAQEGASTNATDVATGQILGVRADSDNDRDAGGFTVIFAAAGTYAVSVRFKTSSGGTLTVQDRKLWVRALAF